MKLLLPKNRPGGRGILGDMVAELRGHANDKRVSGAGGEIHPRRRRVV